MIAWPANCPANVYWSIDSSAWQWMCKSMWEGTLIAGFTVAFISMPLDGLMHMNGKAYPGLKASSTSPPNLAFHSHWQFYEQLERRISLYWLFTGRHVRGYQFADDSVFFFLPYQYFILTMIIFALFSWQAHGLDFRENPEARKMSWIKIDNELSFLHSRRPEDEQQDIYMRRASDALVDDMLI